jgi:ribosomal protein S18 acetylase RimI-like enzyme
VIVRRGTTDDARAVAALELELFGADAWTLPLVVAELAARDRLVLVAISSGELLGYAVTLKAGDVSDLQRLGVRSSARRQGLARELLAEAAERAAVDGSERMLLEVSARNVPALALYEEAGFVEISRRRRYYKDGSDALVLALSLAADEPSGE